LLWPVAALALTVGIALSVLHRPLVLSSVSVDLAQVRGVSTKRVGLYFLWCLAVAVGLASVAVGSVLATALLIGPAATALRVARSLRQALVLAPAVGVLATTGGVVLAFDSSYWEPSSQGLPVSTCIVAFVLALYGGATLYARRRRGR
jgi:zinc/manganese transport system permease protein